ncbi:MAG: carbamoyltransferase N-terminal domain-containing protein, partial [Patescibacteria group bacterium]
MNFYPKRNKMTSKPLRILGINVGHNGGCALCVGGKIVVAINEERLTRRKNTSGWLNALNYCLEAANACLDEMDLVVFSGYRELPCGFDGGLARFGFPKEKCVVADHHLSHACSSFFTSPFEEALVFVYDGHGNNNSTESIYLGKGTGLKKIDGNPISDSKRGIVRAYEAFTAYFGWTAMEA